MGEGVNGKAAPGGGLQGAVNWLEMNIFNETDFYVVHDPSESEIRNLLLLFKSILCVMSGRCDNSSGHEKPSQVTDIHVVKRFDWAT